MARIKRIDGQIVEILEPQEIEKIEPNRSPFLWIIPFLLSIGGIIFICSLKGWSFQSEGFSQFIFFLVSLLAFVITYLIPLKFWRKCGLLLILISYVLMLLTIIGPFSVTVKNASRWINLGFSNFQPFEFLTLAVIIYLAGLYDKTASMYKALLKTTLILIIPMIILFLQPDMGSLLMLFVLISAMFVDRYGWLLPIIAACFALPALGLLLIKASYRMSRINAWLDPWFDPMGKSFHLVQGLIAFANGGIFGVGISRRLDLLPEVHNDFIFPAIAEELGLVGSLSVMLMFLFWTIAAHKTYRRATDNWTKTMIWGCTLSILLPMLINIGGVSGLIPLTGMPLPFISYGGSSLLICWIKIGLLMRLQRGE